MLPFLAAHKRLRGTARYDCTPCMAANPPSARAYMKCGWLPASALKQPRGTFGEVGGVPFIPDVCPGYTTQLPQVHEAARAWSWWEKGQLELRAPEPSELLMELIEEFNGAVAGANDWYIEEARRDAEKHRG